MRDHLRISGEISCEIELGKLKEKLGLRTSAGTAPRTLGRDAHVLQVAVRKDVKVKVAAVPGARGDHGDEEGRVDPVVVPADVGEEERDRAEAHMPVQPQYPML